MSTLEERVEALRKKYGAKAVDNALRLDSRNFPDSLEFRDELDPHYTKLWLDFVYGGLYARGVLDERTRHLVVIAQFIARDDKYGWHGISAGLRLQPTHHPAGVERLDRVDPPFLKLWLDFIYGGLYSRGVLDDRTRLLCMIGICIMIDEQVQGENHVRAALALGASSREVLEVALQATIYAGMPRSLRFIGILERVLEEEGRGGELTKLRPALDAFE